MEVEVKVFEPERDHEIVTEWWNRNGWPPVPLKKLSNFGMVCCVDGVPIAAGWLYFTMSSWVLVEWLVTNPDAARKTKYKALKWLLERFKVEAVGLVGECTLFSTIESKSRGLIRLYESVGFTVQDRNMTNMGLNLCPSQRPQQSGSPPQSSEPAPL